MPKKTPAKKKAPAKKKTPPKVPSKKAPIAKRGGKGASTAKGRKNISPLAMEFCEALLIHHDRNVAMMHTSSTATSDLARRQTASRFLKDPSVLAYLAELERELENDTVIEVSAAVKQQLEWALLDPRELLEVKAIDVTDKEGKVIHTAHTIGIKENAPKSVWRAVQSIKVDRSGNIVCEFINKQRAFDTALELRGLLRKELDKGGIDAGAQAVMQLLDRVSGSNADLDMLGNPRGSGKADGVVH